MGARNGKYSAERIASSPSMAAGAGGTLSALDREICALQVEMMSEKLTVRQKAFGRMVTILSNREEDFLEYMNSEHFETEWSDIFEAVYQGILKQSATSAASVKGKNHDYFVLLHKLSELAMDRDAPRLQYSQLIGACVRALEDASVRANFGVPFLQVLKKFVLSSKWDLTTVSFEEWKGVLRCNFLIMDENQIARQVAVACLSTAVQKFLENCSMPTLLVGYLPQLMEYVRQTETGKVQHELMRVACHIVQALAVDCRTEILRFLESFLPYTIKAYEPKMDSEPKSVLFRLMHLSLIIYYPGGKPQSLAERLTNDIPVAASADDAGRSKTLRQFYYIVTCELKANQSTSFVAAGGREVKFTDGFINFAARLCYTVHWNDDIWNDSNSSEESASKRVKHVNKLQSLLDLVVADPTQHDWRWFIITSVVLERHRGALRPEDCQPLLQLMCDIQASLQSPEQQNAFYRCSTVLLQFERTDAFRSQVGLGIDEAFCKERWTKIITAAFRGCTSTAAKESADSNVLLQLLIRHRKYPNTSFLVGTVLKAFYTHAVKKTNVNVATVLAILETVDSVESLGNVDEVLEKLFNYLYPQTRESLAKNILLSKERLEATLLAKISAAAVVTKHCSNDRTNHIQRNKREANGGVTFNEQDDKLKVLQHSLLLQNIDELITMEDLNHGRADDGASSPHVTYNVNEPLFERLCSAMNFEKYVLPENNCMLATALVNILYDLELYLEILNVLLRHQAYDEASCNKCMLAKKVQFKFQEVILGIQRLLDNVVLLSSNEATEIADRLLAIFRGPHQACVKKLLEKIDVTVALRWTMGQIQNKPAEYSQFAAVISAELLSREDQTKRCFLHIIAHYLQYTGVCTDLAHDMLNDVKLNVHSNLDLFYMFDLCRILLRQPSHEYVADWVLQQFMSACKQHHTSVAVTTLIIELYADLVMFVSTYEDMDRIVATILYSFTKKCIKRTYSSALQAAIVAQIKFLLRAFPRHFEIPLHASVYSVVVPLLNNPSYQIQIEAARTILHFLQPQWAYREESLVPRVYYDFQCTLYGMIKFDELIAAASVDEKMNSISACLQLLLGTFSVSYVLRRRTLRDLMLLVQASNVSDGKVLSAVRLVGKSCGIDATKVLQADMDTVLELWLTRGYKLKHFPYRLAGNATSLEEFVHLHQKHLGFVMLCMKPEQFETFCASIKVESAALMKALLPKCVSFLLPQYAKCEGMSTKYAAMADRMHKAMAPYLRTVDLSSHVVGIVKHITYRLHDSDELGALSEQDVPGCYDDEVRISKTNYGHALEHLRQSICESTGPKCTLLSYLCLKNPSHIERTLMYVKQWLWDTEEPQLKMVHLFQYSALLDSMAGYISQQKETSFKPYLVRDVTYFLCNLLTTFPALRLPTLNSLGQFLQLVVAAGDAGEMLSVHLHFIVSSLLEVENEQPSSRVGQKCFSLLHFLILEQSTTFADAIGKLNYLPNDDRFTELRDIISQQKATDGAKMSLTKEINALTQMPKLRYEDLVALKIMLSNRKDELRSICLKSVDWSVSSAASSDGSVLQRLIYSLIELVRSTPFDKRTVEALRCLGEVGPIDLGTMLLRSEVETVAYDTVDSLQGATKKTAESILVELNVLLTSRNVTVGRAASQTVYQLLHGKTFRAVAAKLPTLRPFMSNSSAEVLLFTNASVPRLTSTLDNERIEYRKFVQQVALVLLSSLKNTMLKALACLEETFAVKIVPMLIKISLKLFQTSVNEEIARFVNGFFEKFAANQTKSQHLFNDPKAVQLMLTIVECVRMHNLQVATNPIVINYLPIAEASKYCQAHFKAILYGELWYQAEAEKEPQTARKDRTLMGIMKSSHLAIGVFDAVKAFLDPILDRTEYYCLEQNHTASLLFQDATLSFGTSGPAVTSGTLCQGLKNCHLYGVARSLNAPGKVDYECLWRLADWSVAIDGAETDGGGCVDSSEQSALSLQSELFERSHYKALKCLELKDELAVESAIMDGRRAIVEMFKQTSTESTRHIYRGLCRLAQLQQVEDFGEIQFYKKIDCEQDLLDKWDQQDQLPYSEFGLMERLLSQRLSIFQTARVRAKRKWIPRAIYNTVLLLIHESRSRGHHDCALRNIRIGGSCELPANVKAIVQLEDAQLSWALGDRKLACDLALEVMENQRYNNLMVNATACRIYGAFMAESHTKEVKALYQDYFKQSEKCVRQALLQETGTKKSAPPVEGAVALEHRCFDSDRNLTVLYTVAKYADRELARLDKYLQSNDWELRRKNIDKMQEEIIRLKQEALKATDQKRKDITRQYQSTHKNMQRDQQAMDTVESNRLDYLQLALGNYVLYAVGCTVESDMVIFRILALWLNNQHEVKVRELLEDSVRTQMIPSHKFIAVLPQLTARLSVNGKVGQMVQDILVRCAVDHPHHTLPYVFAQLYAFRDLPPNEVPENDDRLQGAKALYDRLKNISTIEPIVNQMNRMNLALIELANKTISKNPTFQEYTMTSKDALHRLTNLDRIHCPTVELPVATSGSSRQSWVKGVMKWDAKVVGVGGINVPKKLKCRCLDGVERTQLLKGKDDMRQDAVMQQVFGILNVLLRSDKETAKRDLSIRTYKVVPLSRQSGILEWCNETVPIGVWLMKGHEKYRPQDLKPGDALKKFANNAQPGKTVEDKLRNYVRVCREIQPVFRYYFLEHYLEPGKWFERRQNYTKSVATSSMIGHILGIGDRHVQNILVDKRTAEVIHIDFGIAFEMGKNLPTAETIPFRLTRDIVDGMGMSGVEGVFKRSCEKTMEVLRNNQAPILTILEVLLYDPLYSWNVLSNKKANRQQMSVELRGSSEEGEESGIDYAELAINVTAERALMQVKKKLDGKDDDKFMSVEGQVQKLIFSATNESNLCQLFRGWQPYL